MTRLTTDELDDIRARNPVADIAAGYTKLRRAGGRVVGPCPVCGGRVTSQRFEVFEKDSSWACAVCPDGGDVIRLVEKVEGCDFRAAIERLGGRSVIDATRARQMLEERETKRLAREKEAAKYRENERRRLYRTWQGALRLHGTPAARYLEGRGLTLPEECPGLRYVPSMPYWHGETVDGRGRKSARQIHSGPALCAAFIRADGTFGGLHLTWLEVDLASPPAKAEIVSPDDGEVLNSKKMRGSKTGAHILIADAIASDPARADMKRQAPAPRRLMVGEGIETVLAVYTAHIETGLPIGDTAFWAAGDLGNMAGRATETMAHPTLKRPDGRPQRVPCPHPDPDDSGLTIPDSVDELVLLGDGDSEPILTQYAMERAARRYARPGRTVRIAFAPAGRDFNDVLRSASGAGSIVELIDGALAFVDVDPAAAEEAVRSFGLAELDAAVATLRAATGVDRGQVLADQAERIGALAAAGALHEGFARAALEAAAAECGMIRDGGIRVVKAAIAAGLKRGRKQPRDLDEVRRSALHTQQSRPRPAADLSSSSGAEGDAPTDSTSSSFSAAPPVPRGTEDGCENETLATEDDDGDDAPPPEEITEEEYRYCAALDHSDVDNGKRLIRYFGRDLLVRQEDDVAAGQLLAWTGTHWDLAGGEALAHLIGQKVGNVIKREADFMEFTPAEARAVTAGDAAAKELKSVDALAKSLEEVERIEQLDQLVAAAKRARAALSSRKTNRRKWGVSTKNAGRIASMIKCAAPHLRRHPDAFNADPLKVATLTHTLRFVPVIDDENPEADGTRLLVDRESGRVQYRLQATRGHDRDDMLTAVIPFAYDPKAVAAEFGAFLDLFQPEPKKRRTVQQYCGMSLTAQPVQRIMFHTGTGGNGKSVMLEVLARVFGDGLAVGVPAESVSGQVQNNPSAPTPDIARCYAKRYLRIAELPKDAPLKMETIKKLTGGERWPVRTMYKGYFEFKPTAKPHMSGNGEPKFDGSDGGMKRRLIILEWSVTLPPEKHRDFEDVVAEIVAGGSGILNWLIAGALDFLNNGLVISDDVLKTTADHFADMDPAQQFIDAHVLPDPDGPGVPARQMYEGYKLFAEANGMAKMLETRFGRTMKKKIPRDDTKRVHVYVGVKLHALPLPESQAQPPPSNMEIDDDVVF